jgi:hypothetical protein
LTRFVTHAIAYAPLELTMTLSGSDGRRRVEYEWHGERD